MDSEFQVTEGLIICIFSGDLFNHRGTFSSNRCPITDWDFGGSYQYGGGGGGGPSE